MTIQIARTRELPAAFSVLVAAADAEGLKFVGRLASEWRSGVKRFDKPGEFLLLAWDAKKLVGVGGLNIDPFLDDAKVGRVRHLYVLPSHRGRGIGAELTGRIIAGARAGFERLRVRSFEAGAFYESLGFVPTTEDHATHLLSLA